MADLRGQIRAMFQVNPSDEQVQQVAAHVPDGGNAYMVLAQHLALGLDGAIEALNGTHKPAKRTATDDADGAPKAKRARGKREANVKPSISFMHAVMLAISSFADDVNDDLVKDISQHLLNTNAAALGSAASDIAALFPDQDAYDNIITALETKPEQAKKKAKVDPLAIAAAGVNGALAKRFQSAFDAYLVKFSKSYTGLAQKEPPKLGSNGKSYINIAAGKWVLPLNAQNEGWALNDADYFMFQNIVGNRSILDAIDDNIVMLLLLKPSMCYAAAKGSTRLVVFEPSVLAWDIARCGIVLSPDDVPGAERLVDALETQFRENTSGARITSNEDARRFSVTEMVKRARETHSNQVPQKPVFQYARYTDTLYDDDEDDDEVVSVDAESADVFDYSEVDLTEAGAFKRLIDQAARLAKVDKSSWWVAASGMPVDTDAEMGKFVGALGSNVNGAAIREMFRVVPQSWVKSNERTMRRALSVAMQTPDGVWPTVLTDTLFYKYVELSSSAFPPKMVDFYVKESRSKPPGWLVDVVKAWVDIMYVVVSQGASDMRFYEALLVEIGTADVATAETAIEAAIQRLSNSGEEIGKSFLVASRTPRRSLRNSRWALLGDRLRGLYFLMWPPPVTLVPFTAIPSMAASGSPALTNGPASGAIASLMLTGESEATAKKITQQPMLITYGVEKQQKKLKGNTVTTLVDGKDRGEINDYLWKWVKADGGSGERYVDLLRVARKHGVAVTEPKNWLEEDKEDMIEFREVAERNGYTLEDVFPPGNAPALLDGNGNSWAYRLIDFWELLGTASDAAAEAMYISVWEDGEPDLDSESEASIDSDKDDSVSDTEDTVTIFDIVAREAGKSFDEFKEMFPFDGYMAAAFFLALERAVDGASPYDMGPFYASIDASFGDLVEEFEFTTFETNNRITDLPEDQLDAIEQLADPYVGVITHEALEIGKGILASTIPERVREIRGIVYDTVFIVDTTYHYTTLGRPAKTVARVGTTVGATLNLITGLTREEFLVSQEYETLSTALDLYFLALSAGDEDYFDQAWLESEESSFEEYVAGETEDMKSQYPRATEDELLPQVIVAAMHSLDRSSYAAVHRTFLKVFLGDPVTPRLQRVADTEMELAASRYMSMLRI